MTLVSIVSFFFWTKSSDGMRYDGMAWDGKGWMEG